MWMPCSLDSHKGGPSQVLSHQREGGIVLPVPSRDLTSSMSVVKQHPPSPPAVCLLETCLPSLLVS